MHGENRATPFLIIMGWNTSYSYRDGVAIPYDPSRFPRGDRSSAWATMESVLMEIEVTATGAG